MEGYEIQFCKFTARELALAYLLGHWLRLEQKIAKLKWLDNLENKVKRLIFNQKLIYLQRNVSFATVYELLKCASY